MPFRIKFIQSGEERVVIRWRMGKMIPLLVALLIRLRMEGNRRRSTENSSGANQLAKSEKG